MKIQTLAVAAGVSAPLILSGSAPAGFVYMQTTSKPNAFGWVVSGERRGGTGVKIRWWRVP